MLLFHNTHFCLCVHFCMKCLGDFPVLLPAYHLNLIFELLTSNVSCSLFAWGPYRPPSAPINMCRECLAVKACRCLPEPEAALLELNLTMVPLCNPTIPPLKMFQIWRTLLVTMNILHNLSKQCTSLRFDYSDSQEVDCWYKSAAGQLFWSVFFSCFVNISLSLH